MPSLRPATPEDAAGIAAAHVQAWRESYAGMVDDAFIAAHSEDQRRWLWGKILALDAPRQAVLVVEDAQGIAGFGRAAPNRDEPHAFLGEIQSIYMLDRIKRQGWGRRLMAALADHMAAAGLFPALVWTLRINAPACAFYAALGGRIATQRTTGFGPQRLEEVAYGWPDRAAFLAPSLDCRDATR